MQIRGLTKKGKEFYRFATHLTESIRALHVHDAAMWVAGETVLYQFQDSKEVQCYVSPDRINAVEVWNPWHGRTLRPYLKELSVLLGCASSRKIL